ncbi:MAG: DMT family transporter [Cyanophyceae cyanobacterium]
MVDRSKLNRPKFNSIKPLLILGIGVLAISTGAIFSRWAMVVNLGQGDPSASPNLVGFGLFLAAGRVGVAALSLLPFWLVSRLRSAWTKTAPKALSKNLPASEALASEALKVQPKLRSGYLWAIAAGLCLALHFSTWITSLAYTSIAASTVLVTTNPIWIALATWVLFGDRPNRPMISGIGVALMGSAIVSWSPQINAGNQPWLGNFLALAGAWTFSAYFLLGRTAQRRGVAPSTYAIITSATAAIALAPFPLLTGERYGGHSPWVYLCILLSALIPQLIGHGSLNWAMTQLPPITTSLVILLEPIGASVLAYWIFGEQPGWTVVLGAIAIIGGISLSFDHPSS